jgi:CRISPR-associated protein (TIGR03984 family)
VKTDCEKIKTAFPEKAWVYAESLDAVRIGRWDGEKLTFFDGVDENLLLTLRVFDKERELKFTGDKWRDTADYDSGDFITTLADSKYFMHGEHAEVSGEYTKLWEDRGGAYYFPARLDFPAGKIGLKLGIKNFVRYNAVPVCPAGEKYDYDLPACGAGALEVIDYAYAGFYYADGKEVEL